MKSVAQELRDKGWTTAACLRQQLVALHDEFDGLGDGLIMSFNKDSGYHIEQQPVETLRVSNTLAILQNACDVIVKEVRDVTQQYTVWDIVAPNHVRLRLQFLQVLVQKHEVTLELLMATLDFVRRVGSRYDDPVSHWSAQIQAVWVKMIRLDDLS